MKLARHFAPLLGFAGLSTVLSACALAPAGEKGDETLGQSKSAVIRGVASTSDQDAVILLMHIDLAKHEFGGCTGTLLAPNLVLTARHCVAATDEYAACSSDGKALSAGAVRGNHAANTLYVFTGTQRPAQPQSESDVKELLANAPGRGAEIFDSGATTLCNQDIALVRLEAPIEGAQIAPIRLETDPSKGEVITSVGWGVTEKTVEPDTRQQRTGVKVTAVGPDKTDFPGVPPNEFQVGESICSGDSGGPALASTGAVIGVVSRGGNPNAQQSSNPAANCINATNLYTKTTPFKDLIMEAFAAAEAEPWIEGEADPRLLKADVDCNDPSECRSNLCLEDPSSSGSTCAAECSEDSDCSGKQKCVTVDDVKVCRSPAKKKDDGGLCSGSPGRPVDAGVVAFGVALALVGFGRRSRRRA